MKNVLKLTTLLMLLTLSFGFTSCSDDDDKDNNSIVGTWRCDWNEDGYSGYGIITINANGTWSSEWSETTPQGDTEQERNSGTYTWNNNVMTFVWQDGTVETFTAFVKDGKLFASGDWFNRVK